MGGAGAMMITGRQALAMWAGKGPNSNWRWPGHVSGTERACLAAKVTVDSSSSRSRKKKDGERVVSVSEPADDRGGDGDGNNAQREVQRERKGRRGNAP
jgi:hypothetical protein